MGGADGCHGHYNNIRLEIVKKRISLDNINNFYNDKNNLIINGSFIPLNLIPDIRIKNLEFAYNNNKIFHKYMAITHYYGHY